MDVQKYLENELERRKRVNPSYSLRAFAKHLQISPGRLSEYLNGRRPISKKVGTNLCLKLGLKFQYQSSLDFVESEAKNYTQMSPEAFSVLADWEHFAILSLMDIKGFQSSPKWIAKRLGISAERSMLVVENLRKTGLIIVKDGKYNKTLINLTTTQDIESTALQASHKQSLTQAIEALDKIKPADRDITSMTMAIDIKKLPQAKKMIKEFRRALCVYLEGNSASEVYNLNIQLVPVTKLEEK